MHNEQVGAFLSAFVKKLCPFLLDAYLVTLTHACFILRIENCNGLYLGLCDKTVWKLKLMQNQREESQEITLFRHLSSF